METGNTSPGMFEKVKTWLNFDTIKKKLHLSKDKFIEIGVYLGIGFLVGFLLKKWSHLILLFILFTIGLVVLQQLEVIDLAINWDKVESLFGIQKAAVSTSTLTMFWEWVKLNLLIVISFVVGFFTGFKVG